MPRKSTLFHVGLGAELQRLRETSGMTTRSVATRIGVSAASVSRNETGSRHPAPEEVSALCALYDVTGDLRDRLVEKARDTDGETVRLPSGDQFADQLANIMLLESEAVRITAFEYAFVPGLVQTAEYARAIISVFDRPMNEIERRIATRLGRQAILSRPNGPEIVLLVDEFVLRRCVGSVEVMRRQLDYLSQVGSRPNTTLQIIPKSVGAYAGMEGSFTNYELPTTGPYVYMESGRGGIFLTKAEETHQYFDLAKTLCALALDQDESVKLLHVIKEELSND